MTITPNWKTSRTASKKAKLKARLKVKRDEKDNKAESKRRDGHRCRFPLCGCKKLGLRLESSHDKHKGIGGDPKGLRSDVENLITFCFHRHQDGPVSRHKGTMQTKPLDAKLGHSGPVAFLVDVETLERFGLSSAVVRRKANAATGFVEVARERAVQVLLPLEDWQRELLEAMSELEV